MTPRSTKKKSRVLRESDLYAPVRDYLAAQGYTVHSEVKDCDITATKGNDLIVIELKRTFNTSLLFQATERQRLTRSVYVAVPHSDAYRTRNRWKGVRRVLRRLELGLILVNLSRRQAEVEVVFHPLPSEAKRSSHARRAVLEEISGRSADLNEGGSTRRKIVTAYRENALFIAHCLYARGTLTPKQLRALGAGAKTSSILQANFYGWFERVARGLYRLMPAGKTALEQYPELVQQFNTRLEKESGPP